MKRLLVLLLCGLLLTGCVARTLPPEVVPIKPTETQPTEPDTEPPTSSDPVTEPPTVSNPVTVVIYYGNDNADGFETTAVTMDELDLNLVVEKLMEAGVLKDGTALLSHDLSESCLHLDFNEAFREHLNTMGTAGERMMMGSVVNTFLGLYDADSVFITVNGEIIESGHVVYDFEMKFFE